MLGMLLLSLCGIAAGSTAGKVLGEVYGSSPSSKKSSNSSSFPASHDVHPAILESMARQWKPKSKPVSLYPDDEIMKLLASLEADRLKDSSSGYKFNTRRKSYDTDYDDYQDYNTYDDYEDYQKYDIPTYHQSDPLQKLIEKSHLNHIDKNYAGRVGTNTPYILSSKNPVDRMRWKSINNLDHLPDPMIPGAMEAKRTFAAHYDRINRFYK